MDYEKFKSLANMATTMREYEHWRQDFWHGFLKGLRRLYHGDNFGTDKEHEKWMNCRNGDFQRDMQTGYRTGYYYESLSLDDSIDLKKLRKLLKLSTADMSDIALVSSRTIEGWEQGREMPETAKELIKNKLMIR